MIGFVITAVVLFALIFVCICLVLGNNTVKNSKKDDSEQIQAIKQYNREKKGSNKMEGLSSPKEQRAYHLPGIFVSVIFFLILMIFEINCHM